MREDLSRDDVVAAVDRFVEDLLATAELTKPPVDAIQLAQKHLGIVVCREEQQRQRGRGQRAGGQRQVYLRPESTEERHQWTVAHAVGEHFKPQVLQALGVAPTDTRPVMGESLANLFANRFLVPACWFGADAREFDHDLLQLKDRYRTASHEVIALRLLDLSEPCIITIIDNDHIHRRRSNAWPVRRRLEPIEQQCQRYVHHYSRPHTLREDGWSVWGWPVHLSDWKREILRSVVDEDAWAAAAGADEAD
ncbi:MAG TPA: ImmA/IrrE family metallo-endopeptidase [Gemmataceae bacterium]|nr:ImmA/IrrE family metallo-endopeptidase [Gemmataceae bacterium]